MDSLCTITDDRQLSSLYYYESQWARIIETATTNGRMEPYPSGISGVVSVLDVV